MAITSCASTRGDGCASTRGDVRADTGSEAGGEFVSELENPERWLERRSFWNAAEDSPPLWTASLLASCCIPSDIFIKV